MTACPRVIDSIFYSFSMFFEAKYGCLLAGFVAREVAAILGDLAEAHSHTHHGRLVAM